MNIKDIEEQYFENFIAIIPLNCKFDIGYTIINKSKNIISLDNKYTVLNGIVIDIDESYDNTDVITIIGLKSNILMKIPFQNFKHKISTTNISEDPMWNIQKKINKHGELLFEKSMDIIHNTEH